MFGFISSKKAEEDRIAFGKAEYFRGAEDAAKSLKAQEDKLNTEKSLQLMSWNSLKEAEKELETRRALVILEGIKGLFGR